MSDLPPRCPPPATRVIGFDLPACWREWLLDEGSLTERLLRAGGDNLEVRITNQAWGVPHPAEVKLLQLRQRQRAIIREVELYCRGRLCVSARSIIPHSSLSGPLRRLKNWSDKPLGAFLFKLPRIQRELVALGINTRPTPGEIVCSRSSLFSVGKKRLLVTESFIDKPRPYPSARPGVTAASSTIMASQTDNRNNESNLDHLYTA